MKKLLFLLLLFTSCSKHADKPAQPVPTTYILNISTFIVNEQGGAKSVGINYTVATRITSLQLIRDADGVLMEAHTEVAPGQYKTYDRNNYQPGAKYHFLINNKDEVSFTTP